MLNRFYTQYQVRHIGLEGLPPKKAVLNLAWAHSKPYLQAGQKITAREDVIAHTLKAGEISSAEFMGLIYADAVVHGIDDPKLYAVRIAPGATAGPPTYLLNLALARMKGEQRSAFQALYNQKKVQTRR